MYSLRKSPIIGLRRCVVVFNSHNSKTAVSDLGDRDVPRGGGAAGGARDSHSHAGEGQEHRYTKVSTRVIALAICKRWSGVAR